MSAERRQPFSEVYRVLLIWRDPDTSGPPLRRVFGPFVSKAQARQRLQRELRCNTHLTAEVARVESSGRITWADIDKED